MSVLSNSDARPMRRLDYSIYADEPSLSFNISFIVKPDFNLLRLRTYSKLFNHYRWLLCCPRQRGGRCIPVLSLYLL